MKLFGAFAIIVIFVLVYCIRKAEPYAAIQKPELTREVVISENVQADFNKAVEEMVKELQSQGCKEWSSYAITDTVKDNKIIVITICVRSK